MFLHVNICRTNEYGQIPTKQHKFDACYDLYSISSADIPAHGHQFFDLGIQLEIPDGFVGIIKGRSGLTKKGIVVPTGTIDCNYRGNIGVTLYNFNDEPFRIEVGQRIAQFTIQEMCFIGFTLVPELTSTTDRGANGFGSTGLN